MEVKGFYGQAFRRGGLRRGVLMYTTFIPGDALISGECCWPIKTEEDFFSYAEMKLPERHGAGVQYNR
ncbi:MAG: hypothetical protein R2744_11355 [Bacteroidales bacterium]